MKISNYWWKSAFWTYSASYKGKWPRWKIWQNSRKENALIFLKEKAITENGLSISACILNFGGLCKFNSSRNILSYRQFDDINILRNMSLISHSATLWYVGTLCSIRVSLRNQNILAFLQRCTFAFWFYIWKKYPQDYVKPKSEVGL